MCDLYVVAVDTRGLSSSDIDGYEEHTCSQSFFKEKIVNDPDVICCKSKVAALCGLDLKIYFRNHVASCVHEYWEETITDSTRNNRAAMLLTLDPDTGFAKYNIQGVAYVVLNDGLAALSFRQVWGLQEMANNASDIYKCDPEHRSRGKRELKRWAKQYRKQLWGPLSIYKPRPEGPIAIPPPTEIRLKHRLIPPHA